MDITIKVIETVYGDKPAEQMDFLVCKMQNKHINIVAYLKGNGYVKLFSYQNFFKWYLHEDSETNSINIDQDLYNTNRPFERFIMQTFFGVKLPKEDLMFTFMGNGVDVCDRLQEEFGDYMSIAHICYEREITYYKEVSPEGKSNIERMARESNISPVTQPQMYALKPIEQ